MPTFRWWNDTWDVADEISVDIDLRRQFLRTSPSLSVRRLSISLTGYGVGKGVVPTATPLISTFAPEGVLVMRSFSACAALVKKAKEMSAIVLRPYHEVLQGSFSGRSRRL